MYGSKYAVTDAEGVKRLAQLVTEKNGSKRNVGLSAAMEKKLIPNSPEARISTIGRSGQAPAGTPLVRRALKHDGEDAEAGHVFIPITARETSTPCYNGWRVGRAKAQSTNSPHRIA